MPCSFLFTVLFSRHPAPSRRLSVASLVDKLNDSKSLIDPEELPQLGQALVESSKSYAALQEKYKAP